jgi:8-oxo-dGTP pyrophosphatase MutT (NUDIX family)
MGAGQSYAELLRKKPLNDPDSNSVDPSHLRQLRGAEQVAAVCYRMRGSHIEFLLVQTDAGRWTFPKGKAEPGLTHAQSAALEAFEEAGVHGRIEAASFARYTRRKRSAAMHQAKIEVVIKAHLCEVLWLEEPQEAGRTPTWFPAEKARRRLSEHRRPQDATEHCRVLELAIFRLRRKRSQP